MKNILLLLLIAWSTNAFTQKENSIANQSRASLECYNHIRPDFDELNSEASISGPGYVFGNQRLNYPELITQPIQKYDSIVFWKWDTFTYDWRMNSRHVDFEMLPDNKLLSYKAQLWDGMAWKDNLRYRNEYDTRGNLIYTETMRWSGGSWMNSTNTTYTYNDSSKLVKVLSKGWNGADWINAEQRNYIYNHQSHLEIYNRQYWDENEWKNLVQHFYTYNDNDNEATVTIQIGDGNLWVNSSFVTTTYDTSGYRIADSIQVWENESWKNSVKIQLAYTSTKKFLNQIRQLWANDEWVASQFVTYTYDANDSLATLLVQLWMDDHWVIDWEGTYFYDVNNDLVISNTNLWRANEWIPYIQRRYTYDNNHFQKSSLFLRFNDDGTAYISGDSTLYYFSILSATHDQAEPGHLFNVYPNPSLGKFTISNAEADEVEVFNIAGIRVYATALHKEQSSFEIDLTPHGTGIYFVVLHQGSKMYSRKIGVQ